MAVRHCCHPVPNNVVFRSAKERRFREAKGDKRRSLLGPVRCSSVRCHSRNCAWQALHFALTRVIADVRALFGAE